MTSWPKLFANELQLWEKTILFYFKKDQIKNTPKNTKMTLNNDKKIP